MFEKKETGPKTGLSNSDTVVSRTDLMTKGEAAYQ